jgi:long-chain acyl-CoA synthetase
MARAATAEQIDHRVIDDRAASVGHLFRERVAASGATEAFRYPEGGGWAALTWQQTADRAYALAAGLIDLGVAPEERVALASGTRLEWVLADLAVMCAGAATTTIYPTSLAGDVAYILADSGSRIVIAENADQVAKLEEHRADLSEVAKVVVIDPEGLDEGGSDWVMTLAELEERGKALLATSPKAVDERIDGLTPDHLATIIYTSGTTGRPKGVRLPHSAWTYEGAAVDAIQILTQDDLQYLWLPLAHVFGKVLLVLPLQIGFPTVVDGRVDKIVENLAVVKPTFMGAAPRIFEKAYGRITTTIAQEGGVKAKLFGWASGVGARVADLRRDGRQPGRALTAQHALADKLVLHKVRERFGGRIRFFISGSAALNEDIARWFDSVGLLILEGYGLTETSAASSTVRCRVATSSAASAGRCRAPRCGSPTTGRSCSGARGSPRATTDWRRRPGSPWTTRVGSAPVTSGNRTPTASCGSPTARRTCSRPPAASMSLRRRSSRSSRASAPTPASWSSRATGATSSRR